jgi:hypothetical protein
MKLNREFKKLSKSKILTFNKQTNYKNEQGNDFTQEVEEDTKEIQTKKKQKL